MTLVIPIPEVTVEDIPGNEFMAEKPMNLTCGAVTFPDGNELKPAQAQQFDFRLYRRLDTGMLQVWDEASKTWVPETPATEPSPLAFMENVWQNVIVAIGQKDESGQDKFATDRVSGFPKYYVRCLFSATDVNKQQHEGISPPSAEFTVYAAGELDRAGLTIEPDPENITKAEEIRLFLKDEALISEQGVVAIREQDSGFEIALTVSGASIRMNNDGDIELTPAAGRTVQLQGDVNVDGALTVQDGLTVHNSLTVQDSLTVQGQANLVGGVVVNNGLNVTGNVYIQGRQYLDGRPVGP